MSICSVVDKSWGELTTTELYKILKLRTDVFFVEQRIDEEELDNRDQEPGTRHLWTADDTGITAYLRIIVDDEPAHLDATTLIGRVVTDPARRGRGLASVLVARALELRGDRAILLHAQVYIAGMYAKFGFEAFGEEYVEANLPHISMYRPGIGAHRVV